MRLFHSFSAGQQSKTIAFIGHCFIFVHEASVYMWTRLMTQTNNCFVIFNSVTANSILVFSGGSGGIRWM